jgi:hypothetical protein
MFKININSEVTDALYDKYAMGTSDSNDYLPFYAYNSAVLITEGVIGYYLPMRKLAVNYINRYSQLFDHLTKGTSTKAYKIGSEEDSHFIYIIKGAIFDESGAILMLLTIKDIDIVDFYEYNSKFNEDGIKHEKFKLFVSTKFMSSSLYTNVFKKIEKEYISECINKNINVEYTTSDNIKEAVFKNPFKPEFNNMTQLNEHLKEEVSILLNHTEQPFDKFNVKKHLYSNWVDEQLQKIVNFNRNKINNLAKFLKEQYYYSYDGDNYIVEEFLRTFLDLNRAKIKNWSIDDVNNVFLFYDLFDNAGTEISNSSISFNQIEFHEHLINSYGIIPHNLHDNLQEYVWETKCFLKLLEKTPGAKDDYYTLPDPSIHYHGNLFDTPEGNTYICLSSDWYLIYDSSLGRRTPENLPYNSMLPDPMNYSDGNEWFIDENLSVDALFEEKWILNVNGDGTNTWIRDEDHYETQRLAYEASQLETPEVPPVPVPPTPGQAEQILSGGGGTIASDGNDLTINDNTISLIDDNATANYVIDNDSQNQVINDDPGFDLVDDTN